MSLHLCVKLTGILILFLPFSICNHCHANEGKSAADFLDIAENAVRKAKHHMKIRPFLGLHGHHPIDCAEIYERNTSSKDGIYKIWPRSRVIDGPIKVFCEMEDDGGAWTVLQRRGDFDSEKDYFYRDWDAYKRGFGDPTQDFWIGNDIIFALTNQRESSVMIILWDWEENSTYAVYDEFWIDDEDHRYTMHVKGYRGDAGDSFSYTDGLPFSTKDKDNDQHSDNCAVLYKAGWWYDKCHDSNLNGLYLKGAHESFGDGVNWLSFRGTHYSLKDSEIKIRPKDFVKVDDLGVNPE